MRRFGAIALVFAVGAASAAFNNWDGAGVNAFGPTPVMEGLGRFLVTMPAISVVIAVVGVVVSLMLRRTHPALRTLMIVGALYLGLVAGSAALYAVSLTRPEPSAQAHSGFMTDVGGGSLSTDYRYQLESVASLGTATFPGSDEAFPAAEFVFEPAFWEVVVIGLAAGIAAVAMVRRGAAYDASAHRTSASSGRRELE